jgi:CRP-like cAMP-binding protein
MDTTNFSSNLSSKNTHELTKIVDLYSEEIRVMLATLKMSRLGGLSVAECEKLALQAKLFAYFREQLATNHSYLYPFEVNKRRLNLVNSLTELIEQANFQALTQADQYKSVVFFVYGLDKLSKADRSRFFQLLNASRDRFTQISQPIVIWAKPALVIQMTKQAPDFWRLKEGLFNFPADVHETVAIADSELEDPNLLQRYVDSGLRNSGYRMWRDLYFPLKAIRITETVNLATPRHTYTDEELAQLTALFPHDVQEIRANQIILKKGAEDTGCYVLLEGEVEVIIPDSLGNEVVISRLSRGDFFGEIALVKNIPRTATVRSLTKCRYILLTKPKLRVVASRIASLLELMGKTAEHRLKAIGHASEVMSPLRRFASQGSLIRPAPADVFEVIEENQKIVILGEAGTGKTTVLRAVTLNLLEQAKDALAQHAPVRLPIFIRLNTLSSDKSIEDLILDAFQSYGLAQFETRAEVRHFLKHKKQNGLSIDEFVFIMDGLNEMKDQAVTQEALNDFIHRFSKQRFVISCRAQDYVPIQDFRTALLQPLTERDIEAFLIKYMGAGRGQKVAREIHDDPSLVDLAQTPLALYMLTQITREGTESLPKNRGLLFDRFTDNLLERIDTEWWKGSDRYKAKSPLKIRKKVLSDLGLVMQEEQVITYPEEKWLDSIPHQAIVDGKTITRADIFEELKFSGLIRYTTEDEQNRVEFAHHSYQEFFAALALRDQGLSIAEYLDSGTISRHWQGVIILLYGITSDRTNLFSQVLGKDNDYGCIWLAAQCLANSGEEITVATERLQGELPSEQHFAMLFSVGMASYLLRRYPEALTYLLRAAAEQPGNAEVQYELGSLYRQLDQYKRAITHLEAAIRLRPDFVDAYNQLGITYYDQAMYEEALTIFTATTHLEPNNAYHYYNLGSVQKVLKDYEAARNSFQIAIRLKEDYTEARIQLDLLEKAFSSGVVKVLKSIPMLSKLTLEQTIMLANRLKVTDYKAGQIIFHMGETGDTFYIIEHGTVEVLAPDLQRIDKNQSPVINTLKAGDFFGEIALLRSVPRTATIRCTADTRLLELSRDDFTNIINHHPSIAYSLAETSSYRLSDDRKAGRRADLYYNFNYLQGLVEQEDEVTVLMGDIHGSTFLTNAIGPELMVAFLDEYLLRMSTIIVNAGGAVDKSLGDSVMGVFGHLPERPGEIPISPAIRSLLAALQMRQAYLELREEWKSKSPVFMQTGMGIGINTGPVKIGTVGAEASMVGSAVNISNKLSKMAIKGRDESEIYIDEKTYQMLGEAIEVELLDPAYVRAKAGGVDLKAYRVVRNIDLDLGSHAAL